MQKVRFLDLYFLVLTESLVKTEESVFMSVMNSPSPKISSSPTATAMWSVLSSLSWTWSSSLSTGLQNCPTLKFEEAMETVRNWFESIVIIGKPVPSLIVNGDFNFPAMKTWNSNDQASLIDAVSARVNDGLEVAQGKIQMKILNDFCEEQMLSQVLDVATREEAHLDLIFTNSDNLIKDSVVEEHISLSDHRTIVSSLDVSVSSAPPPARSNLSDSKLGELDFRNLDEKHYKSISDKISISSWKGSELTADDLLTTIIEVTEVAAESVIADIKAAIPMTSAGKEFCSKNRIPREVRTLLRKKSNVSKKLRAATSEYKKEALGVKLEEIETSLRDSLREKQIRNESKILNSLKTNPNLLYSYVKKLRSTQQLVGPFLSESGEIIPETSAEVLNSVFCKVFSEPDTNYDIDNVDAFFSVCDSDIVSKSGDNTTEEPENDSSGPPIIPDFCITEDQVRRSINEQSLSSARGPDGFPAALLKNCKESLTPFLTKLFNHSLSSGEVPLNFCKAIVKPLLKSGKKKTDKSGFRPIALTSLLSKAMERCLRSVIQEHLESNNLLTPHQHGFRAGRSCLSQLLQHYDETVALEAEDNLDVVYLDYAKAFDKVDIGILSSRLLSKGISGKLGCWIHNWLSGRTQCVVVDGQSSSEARVTSGVPQGLVLGPVLFLVMIDSIADCGISSWIRIFADDTRIGNRVRNEEDAAGVQEDLDVIYSWQCSSNMCFNCDKFEVIQITVNEELKGNYNYLTPSQEALIERKSSVKDLGVIMSESGDFEEHIKSVITKVRRLMSWVKRCFVSRSPVFMKFIWRTYIQPHLDYASQLWSPGASKELQNLEALQRTFSSWISDSQDSDYWQRLVKYKLNSIERRFERYKIILTWKILEGLSPNCGIASISRPATGRLCQIPGSIGRRSSARSLRASSFQVSGPALYNCLPPALRNLSGCSIQTFKLNLDSHLDSP